MSIVQIATVIPLFLLAIFAGLDWHARRAQRAAPPGGNTGPIPLAAALDAQEPAALAMQLRQELARACADGASSRALLAAQLRKEFARACADGASSRALLAAQLRKEFANTLALAATQLRQDFTSGLQACAPAAGLQAETQARQAAIEELGANMSQALAGAVGKLQLDLAESMGDTVSPQCHRDDLTALRHEAGTAVAKLAASVTSLAARVPGARPCPIPLGRELTPEEIAAKAAAATAAVPTDVAANLAAAQAPLADPA